MKHNHSCSKNISIGDSVKIIGRRGIGRLQKPYDISGTYLVIGKNIMKYNGRIDLIIKIDENHPISSLSSNSDIWGEKYDIPSIYYNTRSLLIDDQSDFLSPLPHSEYERIITIYKKDQNVS